MQRPAAAQRGRRRPPRGVSGAAGGRGGRERHPARQLHAAPRGGPPRRRRAGRAVPVRRRRPVGADRRRLHAGRHGRGGRTPRCGRAPARGRRRPASGSSAPRARPCLAASNAASHAATRATASAIDPERPSASSVRHASATADGPDVRAARLEAVRRPDHRLGVAGGRRLAHRLELDRRVVEVGVDELVDEREVPAGDVEQVAERLGVQARRSSCGQLLHAASRRQRRPARAG